MKSIIGVEEFIQVFKNKEYRKKLDNIILEFFGLENTNSLNEIKNEKGGIYLEFIIFIEKQYITEIIVKDTKKLFSYSKKFYINFSFKASKRNYILLYPCYWEIYCKKCLHSKKYTKRLEILGALLAAQRKVEIKPLLTQLNDFNKEEIEDILNQIFVKERM